MNKFKKNIVWVLLAVLFFITAVQGFVLKKQTSVISRMLDNQIQIINIIDKM